MMILYVYELLDLLDLEYSIDVGIGDLSTYAD